MERRDAFTHTGPIDCPAPEEIRKEPYSLPASFQWADLNLDNDEEVRRKSLTGSMVWGRACGGGPSRRR